MSWGGIKSHGAGAIAPFLSADCGLNRKFVSHTAGLPPKASGCVVAILDLVTPRVEMYACDVNSGGKRRFKLGFDSTGVQYLRRKLQPAPARWLGCRGRDQTACAVQPSLSSSFVSAQLGYYSDYIHSCLIVTGRLGCDKN